MTTKNYQNKITTKQGHSTMENRTSDISTVRRCRTFTNFYISEVGRKRVKCLELFKVNITFLNE